MGRKKNYYPGWDIMRAERLEATKELRARLAQGQKELREFYKTRGICTKCKKREAVKGQTLCLECKLYSNQSRSGYVEHSQKFLRKERIAGRIK